MYKATDSLEVKPSPIDKNPYFLSALSFCSGEPAILAAPIKISKFGAAEEPSEKVEVFVFVGISLVLNKDKKIC